MVVGLFNDVLFQQGAGNRTCGMLVAYSDGLIEPENVYGEEFGTMRLVDRHAQQGGVFPRDCRGHDACCGGMVRISRTGR